MFYLVSGIIEIGSMIGLYLFKSGVVANVCGLLLFMFLISIPLANFMTLSRGFGTSAIKSLCLLVSVFCTLFVLLGLNSIVVIPDNAMRLMMVLVGASSILIYVDKKLNPGHRSVEENSQDTLY